MTTKVLAARNSSRLTPEFDTESAHQQDIGMTPNW